MSKLNQIQNKIRELGDGEFQKLADVYLHARGYEDINPLGSVIGASKVRKGTPDSFKVLNTGKYIFFEHTTQQTKVYEKIKGDLHKCFDEKKTGISVADIQEIIFCHTSSLTPAQEKEIRDLCQAVNVNINIFGIGPISFDLLQKYPAISRDFLDVEVDTGQILRLEEFIQSHNKNPFTTSLNTSLYFREDDLNKVITELDSTDFVVITGRSGVGKSKLAAESCKKFKELHGDIEVWCVFNRGVNLFEDLNVYFSNPKPYLIFVDDANRLNQLDYILQWLHKQDGNRRIKIIATVRDYAIEKIQDAASPYGGYREIEVKPMSDDQIKQLLQEEFKIVNFSYLERIASISKGNPRLAIMAAQIAKRENTLNSISDVTTLYEQYFKSIKNDINAFDDVILKKTAGIVSFFRTIDFSNKDQMSFIEVTFGISMYDFKSAVIRLHDIEVFDMYENEAVKVSDQVLATYLFYLTFFKDEELDLSIILNMFFEGKVELIEDSMNAVLEVFWGNIINKLKNKVIEFKQIVEQQNEESVLLQLFDTFWFVDTTQTLLYARNAINPTDREKGKLDILNLEIPQNINLPRPSLFSILGKFKYSGQDELKMATELLLLLLIKRPSSFLYVYHTLSDLFIFDLESHLVDYRAQQVIIDVLCNELQRQKTELMARLFLEVSKKYLCTKFESTVSKGKTVYIRNFELYNTESLCRLREKIWGQLFELFKMESYTPSAIKVLHEYCSPHHNVCTSDIIRSDSVVVLPLLDLFDKKNYTHCKVIQDYLYLLSNYDIQFDPILKEHFSNDTYVICKLLFEEFYESKDQELDYDRLGQLRSEAIREFITPFTLDDFKTFFEHCEIIKNNFDARRTDDDFKKGLLQLFDELSRKDSFLCVEVFNLYLAYDESLILDPGWLMHILLPHLNHKSVKEVINGHSGNKDKWLVGFYLHLKEEYITEDDATNIIYIYQETEITFLPYYTDFLMKYLKINGNIITTVTRIILERSKNDKQFIKAIEWIFYNAPQR